MSTQSNRERAVDRIFRIPTVAAGIGLLLSVAVLMMFETLGARAKSGFFMRLLVAVMAANSALAVAVLLSTAIMAVRRRRRAPLLVPWLTVLVLLCLTWGIMYPSHLRANEGIACTQEIAGFSSALLCYIEDHDGHLPGSLHDLIAAGYIDRDGDGGWCVFIEELGTSCPLRNPEWFDVAWGVSARDIDAEGMVAGQKRPLVQPAANVDVRSFDSVCRTVSKCVGQHVGTAGGIGQEAEGPE